MATLFDFFIFLVLVLMVVGLIWPKIILPKSDNPTRLKALGSNVVVLVIVLVISAVVTPAEEPELADTRVATMSTEGIGIPRAQSIQFFNRLGIETFTEGQPVKGRENWIGESIPAGAVGQILGPAENVTSVSLSVGFGGAPPRQQEEKLLQLVAITQLVIPDKNTAMQWVGEGMAANGADIARDGLRAELVVVKEMGMVVITISAAE